MAPHINPPLGGLIWIGWFGVWIGPHINPPLGGLTIQFGVWIGPHINPPLGGLTIQFGVWLTIQSNPKDWMVRWMAPHVNHPILWIGCHWMPLDAIQSFGLDG